jgi:hypothetical protein
MRSKILALLGVVALLCAMTSLKVHNVQAQERSNTFYAAQFPGADAGTKIANAQAACSSPNPNLPCVIVIDAILTAWPQGTRPALCSTCIWMDYSFPNNFVIVTAQGLVLQQTPGTNNGTLAVGQITTTAGIQPQTSAIGANLGSQGARFAQINIGDQNGGVRWINPGTYTGNRALTVPDGNSGTMLSAALTTTAAASDNVAMQGVTASSHCQLEPTNASAATNITTTFVSAKTANQITVTHTATAGMTYDINCSGN